MENLTTLPENNSDIFYEFGEVTPYSVVIMLWILYGLTSIVAVFGNILVIYVIITSPGMHSITYCLITNLSVADAIIGMFSIPFQVCTSIS